MVTLNPQDCTQREFVTDLAKTIYRGLGYIAPDKPDYFFDSQHPTEIAILAIAETIFEQLTGDTHSYDDDPDEDHV